MLGDRRNSANVVCYRYFNRLAHHVTRKQEINTILLINKNLHTNFKRTVLIKEIYFNISISIFIFVADRVILCFTTTFSCCRESLQNGSIKYFSSIAVLSQTTRKRIFNSHEKKLFTNCNNNYLIGKTYVICLHYLLFTQRKQ